MSTELLQSIFDFMLYSVFGVMVGLFGVMVGLFFIAMFAFIYKIVDEISEFFHKEL